MPQIGDPVQHCPADDFVHGIMPTHIFPDDYQFAVRTKQGRAVQAARTFENRLGVAQTLRNLAQSFR